MAVFKFVISDNGKSYQLEVDQAKCEGIIGLKIGDKFSGDIIGLNGYELKITGGTDRDGFSMRADIEGMGKKRILISKSCGFRGKKRIKKRMVKIKGLRRRKTVRGNTISNFISQINCVVVKRGEKSLEELIPKKEKK
ncbi:MAG: 30S ribosomal protein S6e [Candidatus Aenigmatarchaeota archaeon]|nr:30S ribosomal protein S6e [Candidatus Aenigmarchaeota archaeon]